MLQQLKFEIRDTLLADPYFGDAPGIPVLDERRKELDSDIDIALAKIGICVVIVIVRASVTEPFKGLNGTGSNRGPFYKDIVIICRVFELPILNEQNNEDGTGKTALETAQTIHGVLNGFRPFNDGCSLVAEDIVLADDPDRSAYDVLFTHAGGIAYPKLQVALPSISVVAGEATITTATAGASIFYSITDAEPSPRSGILYTAPFAVGSGVTIKTRAYLAGYLTSKQASATT